MKVKLKIKDLIIMIGIIAIPLIIFYSYHPGYREFSDIKMSGFSVEKQWQYIISKLDFKGSIGVKDYTLYLNDDGSIETWYSTITVTDKNKISEYELRRSTNSTKITVTRLSKKTVDKNDEKYMDVKKFIKYMGIVYNNRKDFFANATDKDRYDFYFGGGENPAWNNYSNYLEVYIVDHDGKISTISKNQEPLSTIGGCTCQRLDKDYYKLGDATVVFKK